MTLSDALWDTILILLAERLKFRANFKKNRFLSVDVMLKGGGGLKIMSI